MSHGTGEKPVNGEDRFPIYYCEIWWPATGAAGKRMIDSGGGAHMFRSLPSQTEIDKWTAGLWENYRTKSKDPGRPVFQVNFLRWDTWCLGWFHHWTWDVGQSDAAVLDSFSRYVLATEAHNERVRSRFEHEDRCLMGAEDRWRWSGQPEDRKPPCRCDGCKKNGVIRICH